MNKKELTKIISSFVIGDGCLRVWRNVKNAGYSFAQISEHMDYIIFQKEVLEKITKTTLREYEESTDNSGIHRKKFCKLETVSHPFFTTLRERMYFNGRKTVSIHDLKLFDAQSAAIWYMDDGYILRSEDKSQRGNVFLCTDHYNQVEVIELQRVIYEKLNIPFNIRKRGSRKDGGQIYRLVATRDNAKKFIEVISSYVFPSFYYKLSSDEN